MEVPAKYENGRIVLREPLRLKHPSVDVTVIVPDDEVLPETEREPSKADALLADVHSIIGKDYEYAGAGQTDEEILLQALKDKHSE